MNDENFQRTLDLAASPGDVFRCISQVDRWWAKQFTGKAEHAGDAFTVRFGDTCVDFVVSVSVPDKRIVWKVTDCNLDWIADKKEWKNTEVVFEVRDEGPLTRLRFTHVGLVPTAECYSNCEVGWTRHVTVSLAQLVEQGVGLPK